MNVLFLNQEAHGTHRSPEKKKLKSINTSLYHYVDKSTKTHFKLYENLMVHHLNKLESPSSKDDL